MGTVRYPELIIAAVSQVKAQLQLLGNEAPGNILFTSEYLVEDLADAVIEIEDRDTKEKLLACSKQLEEFLSSFRSIADSLA